MPLASEIIVRDGTRLHVDAWWPEDEALRGVIVLSHGGAEHVGRYDRLARRFVERGFGVFGPDHRGQGRSEGRRGHIDAFETYADDLHQVIAAMRRMHPRLRPESTDAPALPWFLFGHSMGGLIALIYLLDTHDVVPVRGAMISAPLLGLTMKVPLPKLIAGRVAAKLIPRFALPTGIPAEAISRDPDEVERYMRDRKRVDVVTAGWFAAVERAIGRVEAEVARLELPLYWYAGTDDRICDHLQSKANFERLSDPVARDQTFELYPGYYHELHNEPEAFREPVIRALLDWADTRLKPRVS